MIISFGREITNNLNNAQSREWLVTNGIGGYASGTIAGLLTRRYHGLLIAALKPPLGRTLLVSKVEETIDYNQQSYPLFTNRWANENIEPNGYINIENFTLEKTIPTWRFGCGDALLEKRIGMEQGTNTTYIYYTLKRASKPLSLSLKVLVNYRDYHGDTKAGNWQMSINAVNNGISVEAFAGATPFYLLSNQGKWQITHNWYQGFDLAEEKARGLSSQEDHLYAGNLTLNLNPGESITIVLTTNSGVSLDGQKALQNRQNYEQKLLNNWYNLPSVKNKAVPKWIEQLILASDQFIVNRPLINNPEGKTIIAGYHWFGDWGRDTMISLPGLTLTTGRYDIAKTILETFSQYLDQGMLPNLFPDGGSKPEYNTVDAILWYFEAIRAYYQLTSDQAFLRKVFPVLAEVIDWHIRGTRYNIHLDSSDGLIYAGESGVQLTWMDAKVGDWVVTPRIGKPIEINALWYNALLIMTRFALILGKSPQEYELMAKQTLLGFQRFWSAELAYCYDVLDTPSGNDASLRPNQIFAVSSPFSGQGISLLTISQQQQIVDTVAQYLLTSYGLRSLSQDHPSYRGQYQGNPLERDGSYHQGTTWGWLMGHFVQAHLKVYQNPTLAQTFLEPMANHLQDAGLGTISEIFDGDAPITPKGCISQAWSVGEILRAWLITQ